MMRFIGEPVTEQEIEVPVVVIEVPGVVHQRTGHRASDLKVPGVAHGFSLPTRFRQNKTDDKDNNYETLCNTTYKVPPHSYHFFNISI